MLTEFDSNILKRKTLLSGRRFAHLNELIENRVNNHYR
jgi:hypothetical protein